MNDIDEVLRQKDWARLVREFLPINFADTLDFEGGMRLAENLIFASGDERGEEGLLSSRYREFATNLLILLRAKHSQQWNADWKNEAYLGIVCDLAMREEESFQYIRNAFMRFEDPPQSLIFAYISAGTGPDSKLPTDEVLALTKKAVAKGITYEGALRMICLSEELRDSDSVKYWEEKARDTEELSQHTPIITPNILKGMFPLEKGYEYEE